MLMATYKNVTWGDMNSYVDTAVAITLVCWPISSYAGPPINDFDVYASVLAICPSLYTPYLHTCNDR